MTQLPIQRTTLPLSPMLRQIRTVIGFDAMLALAAARGGTRFYIPGTVSHDHWLSQLIGPDLSKKLAAHFAIYGNHGPRGTFLELPLPPKELRVLHLTHKGLSENDIALELGITARTVRRYRALSREAID